MLKQLLMVIVLSHSLWGAVAITLTSVKGATVSVAYSTPPMTASGGSAPYTYAVTSGALPAGISMDSAGAFSGTPTTVYEYEEFGVTATDSAAASSPERKFFIAVFPVFTTYRAINSNTVAGCTASGYFQLLKPSTRWTFADATCKQYIGITSQNSTYVYLETSPVDVLTAHYGATNQGKLFANHTNARLEDWGFTGHGGYSVNSFYDPTLTPTLPVMVLTKVESLAVNHPELCNPAHHSRLKNINNATYLSTITKAQLGGGTMDSIDFYDPDWVGCGQYAAYVITTQFSNAKTNANIIGYILGDPGDGSGPLVGGNSPYPHEGHMIAVTNFAQSGGGGTGTTVWSKAAWITYLKTKYSNTIFNLNTSWGSSYSGFDDAGGWGPGTGVIDEDGRHTAWVGTNPYVCNGSAGYCTDIDAFLRQYVAQYQGTVITQFKTYAGGGISGAASGPLDTNHMYFGFNPLGGGVITTPYLRDPVILGLKDSGVSALFVGYDPVANNVGQSKQAYDTAGLPIIIWWGTSANADSYWNQLLCNNLGNYVGPGGTNSCASQTSANYATQTLRAAAYTTALPAMFNFQGSNGDYYVVDVNKWGLTDDTNNEHTNWGLLTNRDDAYDGNCVNTVAGTDAYGIPCSNPVEGAVNTNYLGPVTQANLALMQSLAGSGTTLGDMIRGNFRGSVR